MVTVGLLAALGTRAPLRAATGRYVVSSATVEDLGTFGGAGAAAWDINNAGHIVGTAQRADGRWQAFKVTSAGMADLDPFDIRSAALTINQASVAGGYAEVPWAPEREQPALFDGGGIRFVPQLARSAAPCQWSAHVFGLNDQGQMSGSAVLEGDPNCEGYRSAVYWNSRSVRPVEHAGSAGYAQGTRINSAGLAVGMRGTLLTPRAFAFTGAASVSRCRACRAPPARRARAHSPSASTTAGRWSGKWIAAARACRCPNR